jgi:nitroreductase
MNNILQSLLSRRSVRNFTDRQIQDEELDLILQAAILAPNGRNQEPWHFTALQDAKKLRKLDELVVGKGASFFYYAPTLILVSIQEGNAYEKGGYRLCTDQHDAGRPCPGIGIGVVQPHQRQS